MYFSYILYLSMQVFGDHLYTLDQQETSEITQQMY